MARTTYAELLADPRWQRRRLEIMQRDNFTCRMCRDTETTLHVHHIDYFRGRKPWEYEDRFLLTLCAECHSIVGSDHHHAFALLKSEFIELNLDPPEIIAIAQAVSWIMADKHLTANQAMECLELGYEAYQRRRYEQESDVEQLIDS